MEFKNQGMVMKKHSYANQIVLVTGGSSGIGLEIARQLSQQGAHVWLVARQADRLAEALDIISSVKRSPEQRFGMTSADVSDPEQAKLAVEQATREIGLPDLVINSAGVAQPGYFLEQDLEIFHQMMNINYFGIVYIAKAVLPGMVQRGSGHIVNISSVTGFMAMFGYSAYAASKYAVAGFSDILRAEMKRHRIRVSIVFPADVDTPQLAYETAYQPFETQALAPLRTVMKPKVFARIVLQDIARGKYLILPGFDSKLMYTLSKLLGTTFYPLFDILMAIMIRLKKKEVN
jgi:3-dehydrosphinganine reductase